MNDWKDQIVTAHLIQSGSEILIKCRVTGVTPEGYWRLLPIDPDSIIPESFLLDPARCTPAESNQTRLV